jgi:hypothetical protein
MKNGKSEAWGSGPPKADKPTHFTFYMGRDAKCEMCRSDPLIPKVKGLP